MSCVHGAVCQPAWLVGVEVRYVQLCALEDAGIFLPWIFIKAFRAQLLQTHLKYKHYNFKQ